MNKPKYLLSDKQILVSGCMLYVLTFPVIFGILVFSNRMEEKEFVREQQVAGAFEENKKMDFEKFVEIKKNSGKNPESSLAGNWKWNQELEKLEKVESAYGQSYSAQDKMTSYDFDGDGITEDFMVEEGVLKIFNNNNLVWQTSEDIWVDDFWLADSNHDSIVEVNYSIWRAGDFEHSKPFWIEENDMSIKNHFFADVYEDKKLKPIWHSSNLAAPNCEFKFADVDVDGKQELVVLEGEYNDSYECESKYLAVWKWNNWGFFNEWQGLTDR